MRNSLAYHLDPNRSVNEACRGRVAQSKGFNMNESDERTTVEITRTFNAPPALVFECMTTPAHLTHFWGPIGTSSPLERIVVDLRPGGEFTTVMVNDETGEEYPSGGTYVEIDPPSKLVWEESVFELVNISTFTETADGATEVHILQQNVPAMFASPEALEGFNSSLHRFADYLATIQ